MLHRVMLELQHLSRSYRGIPAISDVSFQVKAGEIVGFLGPNGAGKSTTVKIITGLLRPNDGRVLFEGRDIHADLLAWRAIFGYIPEEAHLYTWMSAMEYLQLVGRLRGMSERLIEEKATAMLELLGLESWRHSPMTVYSKGMRQRVLMAAALMHDPKMLVFDEPLSGLDVLSSRLFRICCTNSPRPARRSCTFRMCSKSSSRFAIAWSSSLREKSWPMHLLPI
jgi:ABC-2 type transport system ATP-binding protein